MRLGLLWVCYDAYRARIGKVGELKLVLWQKVDREAIWNSAALGAH
jgi:hypothetical protein